ncbi:MAG: alanine--tRNA ligase [Alphaproteobacteria bacterium]
MPSVSDIRSQFLEFFRSKEHLVLPSSSLVPHNDPTLMFTNAGMNQFKNIFTGIEKPPAPPRAATSQKCVRAGGKHNDLDNVGYTARHHTFFEMLGNFSFGDYFKEGAIAHAWELITKVWGISPEKLVVTVFHTDDDAFNLWKKISTLPESRIIRIATNDNFWAMGDTGPCGPCSEIFYDHGEKIPGGPPGSEGADGDRFTEIWNLVFMQYEQVTPEKRVDLPKPSIDTGMGLERISAVLQGVHDNYDIDLFRNLRDYLWNILDHDIKTYRLSDTPHRIEDRQKAFAVPSKVIADHLRASCFLIADGVLPSNEGRGYVLRRIMRRAMRYAHQLGFKEPVMHRLVPALVHEMGDAYPELHRAQAVTTETLKLEETRFRETLERGLKLLEEERARISKGSTFSGEAAFKLYDTYGFPLDLTQDILRADNIAVDTKAFDAAMEQQRAMARAAHKGSGDTATSAVWFDIKERTGSTEFLGYAMDEAQANIVALVKDGKEVQSLMKGQTGEVIVNQTPFYGESGGQVGDVGLIAGKGFSARVMDTFKPLDGIFAHKVTVDDGTLKIGDTVELAIDTERRARIRANHSATHLLHAVLREQLGEHVTQKGSLVAEDRLRFDITHPKQIAREELDRIETGVNRLIWQNSEAATRLMSADEAIKAGAMALFGEKYGSEVRVLTMGEDAAGGVYSIELCGGTHVARTGDIGLFKIVSESAVAAGVRRIEAVTRDGAFAYLNAQDEKVRGLAGALKIKPDELETKVAALAEEKKKLEKQLADAKKQAAMGGSGGGDAEASVETIGSVKLAARIFGELDAKSLRELANSMAQKHADAVSVLLASSEGKASIIVAVGKDIAGTVDAPTLVKAGVAAVGGSGGGGRPDFAQGGGPEGDKLDAALAAMKQALAA